jgi:diadenosine tetraphosphate (Ap4A) HIT family hydrolase
VPSAPFGVSILETRKLPGLFRNFKFSGKNKVRTGFRDLQPSLSDMPNHTEHTECPFCPLQRESCKPQQSDSHAITGLPVITFLEYERFRVIIDIAPLVDGHCLVVPRQHILAFAELSSQELQELRTVLKHLDQAMLGYYGVLPTLFEHGITVETPKSPCCVRHAHLHVVPTTKDVHTDIEAHGVWSIGCDWRLQTLQVLCNKEYLFYRSPQGVGYVYCGSTIPSQLLRKILGTAYHNRFWNWHDYVLFSDQETVQSRLDACLRNLRKAALTIETERF